MDPDEYCRQIEAHLCRRNEGHLVRIVGPAFDKVRAWAELGVPLKVAFQGIDRRVDRAAAAGPRRRPLRLESCDADVLDAFDAWRRAVGVRTAATDAPTGDGAGDTAVRPRQSLSSHLDRVIVRLTALRSGPSPSSEWERALDHAVRRLDALYASASRARGDARQRLLAELESVDAALLEAARHAAAPDVMAEIAREADTELEPFRARLDDRAFDAAHRRCTDRILRERFGLPIVTVS